MNRSFFYGGRESRTPDLQIANLPLYQLSYTPVDGWNIDFGLWFGNRLLKTIQMFTIFVV